MKDGLMGARWWKLAVLAGFLALGCWFVSRSPEPASDRAVPGAGPLPAASAGAATGTQYPGAPAVDLDSLTWKSAPGSRLGRDDVQSQRQPACQDPFFGFLIAISEGDSLGVWTQAELQPILELSGRASKLPLEHFRRLERRVATATEAESCRGVQVGRIWRLTLDDDLRTSMPFSIMGYRPGSLCIARELVASEWRLGERNLYAPEGGRITIVPVTDLTVLRIDSGWIVLDVDGWLDGLLGGKLDDCWTQGFALCRQDGKLHGLTLSINRSFAPLYGEFDFSTDEVLPRGRPMARGMNVLCRPWVLPSPGNDSRQWRYDR